MKKLLFQLDTDPLPSTFDTVVAYDGGADQVICYGNLTPDNIKPLVEGAIFTRGPKDKKNTAIFVGGSDMKAGQALFDAVQKYFFPGFQVAVMLDSNGSNTTAAAGVAKLLSNINIRGKKAVVLAGTGPVGQRAAVLLAQEGADVSITSRQLAKAQDVCTQINEQFSLDITPIEAKDNKARAYAIKESNILFAAGAAGVELIKSDDWQHADNIEIIMDANATPPIGIGGTEMLDKGENRHGKISWGAIGVGAFKLALHRHCIAKLFDDSKQALDAEEIFALAKSLI